MKQNKALEKWIEEDMCNVPCAMPVDEAGEYMCRAAWYAATKHTLAFVVGEVNKDADEMADVRDAELERGLALRIAKMEP